MFHNQRARCASVCRALPVCSYACAAGCEFLCIFAELLISNARCKSYCNPTPCFEHWLSPFNQTLPCCRLPPGAGDHQRRGLASLRVTLRCQRPSRCCASASVDPLWTPCTRRRRRRWAGMPLGPSPLYCTSELLDGGSIDTSTLLAAEGSKRMHEAACSLLPQAGHAHGVAGAATDAGYVNLAHSCLRCTAPSEASDMPAGSCQGPSAQG